MHNSSHKETCLIVNNLRMLTLCLIICSAFRKRMSNRNNIFWICFFGLCIILQPYTRLTFSTTNSFLWWWWREWDSNPRTPKGRDDSYAIPFQNSAWILSPARLTRLRYPSIIYTRAFCFNLISCLLFNQIKRIIFMNNFRKLK